MTRRGNEAEAASGHAGPDQAHETGPALHAHYRFILWLVPAVARFPRSQKFLLGDRIQGLALDVLEALIEATTIPASGTGSWPGPISGSKNYASCAGWRGTCVIWTPAAMSLQRGRWTKRGARSARGEKRIVASHATCLTPSSAFLR